MVNVNIHTFQIDNYLLTYLPLIKVIKYISDVKYTLIITFFSFFLNKRNMYMYFYIL